MIVRTYKRRNKGDHLGFQGSTSLLGVEDDEFRHFSSKSAIGGALPDADGGGALDSAIGRTSSSQFRFSFSLPTSRSGDSLDDFPASSSYSEPSSGFRHDSENLSEQTDLPQKRKCTVTSSAGQKLIRAENLLIKSKAHSSTSSIQVKSRPRISKGTTGVSSEDQQTKRSSSENQFLSRVTTSSTGNNATSSSIVASVAGLCAPPTSTLLEAQESGEMMEHMDEVTFAMDGLSPRKPLRTRRASLMSLLSIFGTRQRRRLLRTHGIMKHVLDVVLTVPTEDSSTALAAAALLYVASCDGQDEDYLDSPACISFLMKLLKPVSPVREEKVSVLGSRLLALSSNSKSTKQEVPMTGNDKGGGLLVDKVKNLLSNTKGWKDGQNSEEDLSCAWLVLLTLEKACLSTVVLEDNAGSVRRVGGHFKEKLRELGGLDALCELAASCFVNLRRFADVSATEDCFHQHSEMLKGSSGVGVLLRCLKVMENVTFLSENNQKHLLDKIMPKTTANAPNTFIAVIIGTINVISDIILARSRHQYFTSNESEARKSEAGAKFRTLRGIDTDTKQEVVFQRNKPKTNFDFDEYDYKTDKDHLKSQISKRARGQLNTRSGKNSTIDSSEIKDPSSIHNENILDECLLSAVKVVMNLTNDNDLGCRRVAATGGLDAVALLISKHFPAFQSRSPKQAEEKHVTKQNTATIHSSQETDLLVVILGVLVNLVEKNTTNRERLASLSTEEPVNDSNEELVDNGIITLLCTIFLSREGSANIAESNGSESISKIDADCNISQEQKEAEDMIVEAYSALLLAFLAKESLSVRDTIAQHLPNKNLTTLVPVLERFLEFHLSLNMISRETHERVRDVIDSCK